MSNARRLASAFGTEQDKYNCSFYHKVGACRHGDRCSRQHAAPALSETVSIPNMYLNPFQVYEAQGLAPPPEAVTEEALQKHLEDFFDDVHAELSNFGGVEDMHVCNNLGVHLNGRVYVKFEDEDSAQAAFNALQGRFYGGRMLSVEFSPVKNFREGRCKQFDEGTCKWGGNCNFMHVYQISDDLEHELFGTKRIQPRRKYPRREARHEPMARRGLYSAPEDYEDARKYREGHGDDRRDSRGYDRPQAEDKYSRDRYDDRRPPAGDRYGGPPPGDRYGGPPNDRYAEPEARHGGPPAEDRYGGPPPGDRYGGPPPGDRYGGPPPGDRYGGPPSGDRYGPPPGDRYDGPPRDGPPRDGRYGGPPRGDRYDGPPAHDRYEERGPPPSNA